MVAMMEGIFTTIVSRALKTPAKQPYISEITTANNKEPVWLKTDEQTNPPIAMTDGKLISNSPLMISGRSPKASIRIIGIDER